ncbi:MAG: PqqD family protein [Clostridia bacterium]|nr:PqqD family protein [Clostridia bacterium]
MKIKKGFILKEIAGNFVVVAVGPAVRDFNGAISLNGVGATLWKALEKENTEDSLIWALLNEYQVEYEKAKTDVENFVNKLKEANLVE